MTYLEKYNTKERTESYEQFLENMLNKAMRCARAYKDLGICYRVGRTPSEKLFTALEKGGKFLKDMGGRMTDLMKRYEAETGKSSMQSITDGIHCVSIDVWHYEYVAWLEHRLLKLERSIRALVRVINITDVPIQPTEDKEI